MGGQEAQLPGAPGAEVASVDPADEKKAEF